MLGDPPAGAEATSNEARSTRAGDAYWAKRQGLLAEQHGLDFGRDKLGAHEIEFYERFLRDGTQRITPIKRDEHNAKPTNYFAWVNVDGIPVEVKTMLKPGYSDRTIARRIRDSVKKARRAGVVKDKVLIDIRDDDLSDGLRRALSRYTIDNPHAHIVRLFVFSRGDCITEVALTC